jgi:hypothetical protein
VAACNKISNRCVVRHARHAATALLGFHEPCCSHLQTRSDRCVTVSEGMPNMHCSIAWISRAMLWPPANGKGIQ